MFKKILVPLSVALLGTAMSGQAQQQQADILLRNRDSAAKAADDFFQFANGGWIKANPIPGDETGWGIGNLVNEELYKRQRIINEDAVKAQPKTRIQQQLADFWLAAMDTAKIEQQGTQPLHAVQQRIAAAGNTRELMKVAAYLHSIGVTVFFGEGVSQDAKNSELMSYQLMQGGLGMPNRDYYFNTDARSAKIRKAYPVYIAQLFVLSGAAPKIAQEKAAAIAALETKLAEQSRKLEALRDPYANYNKMDLALLGKTAPGIAWQEVFSGIGLPTLDTVIVGQPEFYTQLSKVLAVTPLQTLKDYMSFHLLNTFAPYLNHKIVDARFDFYYRTIRGAKEMRPRWKRVLDAEETAIGEVLGQLFVQEYFDTTAKKRYSDMVEAVRSAYRARIEKLSWMSDSTKQKAIAKLNSMSKKVGYPDKWKDFSSLDIDRSSFAGNMMKAFSWWNNYSISKLGKPVDRTEWEMTPQTYNAYYNPSNNEIVLPAGIFTVPGKLDKDLDDGLVYGYAAASTIGHEITHGFDDEGRQFDANGNLHNWWNADDEAQFKKRSKVLADQFSAMVVVDTMRINGNATLGENLADLGGILIGLDAFKQTSTYKEGKMINGYTPLQRYFMGYALGWLYVIRNEQLANQLLTDVHAPAKYRVNGPFPNVPEFYEAFPVKAGDKMYLPADKRVELW